MSAQRRLGRQLIAGPQPVTLSAWPLRLGRQLIAGAQPSAGAAWLLTALVVLAAAAGVVLRFVTASPLWLDEALSVHIASGDEALPDALRRDGHPGLYYLLLRGWIDLSGPGEASVRAMSGVFSLAAVPFTVLAARHHGARLGAAAGVLALTSPYLMRYGSEARMYSLLVALVALGWWAGERALVRPSVPRLVTVAVVVGALLHTHYWALFVVAAALALLGSWALVMRGLAHPERRRAALRVGAALLAGCATLLAWADVLADQAMHTGTPWAKRARPAEVLVETAQAIGGGSRFEGETLGFCLLALAVLGAFAVGGDRGPVLRLDFSQRGRPQAIAAVLGCTVLLGSAVALVTGGGFEGRYAGTVVPFVLVLAARGVVSLPGRAAPVVLCLLACFGTAIGSDEARRDRTQGREVAEAIDAEASPGDVVAFCPDQLGPATVHYLDAEVSTVAYPRGDGHGVDWRGYLATAEAADPVSFARSAAEAAGSGDVWLVHADGYRGFEGRCTAIEAELGRTRSATLVTAERMLFEPMTLVRYSPR